MKVRGLFAAAMLLGSLGISGPATAAPQTVSASVGPVAVPNVPVQACVNSTCQQTPALSSVGLTVTATADANGSLPTVTPGTCSSGAGGTLVVNAGSSSASVAGTVSGTLPDGSSFSQPVGPVSVAPGGTTTISACTTASPGVPLPPLPPLPGVPTVPTPPVPSPTGLVGIILQLVTTLLGGGLPGGLPL